MTKPTTNIDTANRILRRTVIFAMPLSQSIKLAASWSQKGHRHGGAFVISALSGARRLTHTALMRLYPLLLVPLARTRPCRRGVLVALALLTLIAGGMW